MMAQTRQEMPPMPLISESYRELNRQLHEQRPDYGAHGHRWADYVTMLVERMQTKDVLDFGCGKRTLERELGYPIRNFDPALLGLDDTPEPADIVVCGDVLEHVEPEHLDAVLRELQRLTKRVCFMVIATRPAKKTMPDGRNTHLIVQPARWWLETVIDYFEIETWQKLGEGELMCLASRRT